MNRKISENYLIFSILMDAVWIVFTLAFTSTLRPIMSLLPFAAVIPPPYQLPWIIYFLFPLIWVGIFLFLSVYDNRKNRIFTQDLTLVTFGCLLSSFILGGILYLSFRDVSRLFFIGFITITYFGMIVWRLVSRMLLDKLYRDPQNQRKIFIIGTGNIVRKLANEISSNKNPEIVLAGVIDHTLSVNKRPEEIINSATIPFRITNEQITDIVLGFSPADHEHLVELVSILHYLPVKVWLIPDYFQLTLQKSDVEELAGVPLVDLKAPALDYNQRIIKRAFDLGLTLLLLPLSILITIAITLAIRIESPGPIIFRSKRVGENGRLFYMFKFRTMIVDAENQQNEIVKEDKEGNIYHKFSNDYRITRVGKFLRRTSLDEIPQFLNVLRGEMSLVGPRPELPFLVDKYQTWQRQRFTVPQGITGWWQINGRSDKPMHLHTEDDLYYIQNYSLWLDVYIILKTIRVVWTGQGAF